MYIYTCTPHLCSPMGCSPTGYSGHGIFQARILEQVAISCFRGSSDPGVKPVSLASPALPGRFFTTVPLGKLLCLHTTPLLSIHLLSMYYVLISIDLALSVKVLKILLRTWLLFGILSE